MWIRVDVASAECTNSSAPSVADRDSNGNVITYAPGSTTLTGRTYDTFPDNPLCSSNTIWASNQLVVCSVSIIEETISPGTVSPPTNLIWPQCGIRFNLVSTTFIDNTTFLTPNATQREDLRNTNTGTGGFEIYYVDSFPDNPDLRGENSINGIVIGDAGNSRTTSHELGHAFGLGHRGIDDVSLMWGFFSITKADIILTECTSLSIFSHS